MADLLELTRKADFKQSGKPEVARIAFEGGTKPRIEDSLTVAEIAKRAFMSERTSLSGNVHPPLEFIGHRNDGAPVRGHTHAYIISEDVNMDGRIDYLTIYCIDGFSNEGRHRMRGVKKLFARNLEFDSLHFEDFCSIEKFKTDSKIWGRSKVWKSATPFLKTRYKHGYEIQVKREAELANLPIPDVTVEEFGIYENKPLSSFKLTRKNKRQPDNKGCFLKLSFPEVINGPIILGYWSHFGMGLFLPFINCGESK